MIELMSNMKVLLLSILSVGFVAYGLPENDDWNTDIDTGDTDIDWWNPGTGDADTDWWNPGTDGTDSNAGTDGTDGNSGTDGTNGNTGTDGTNSNSGSRACGVTADVSERIVEGEKVKSLLTYPWMVKVLFNHGDAGWNMCGGGLISSSWVLSAAHCLYSDAYAKGDLIPSADKIIGVLSNLKLEFTQGQGTPMSEYKMHKDYHRAYKFNDIALFKFQTPVSFSDKVLPLCLPCPSMFSNEKFVGKTMRVAGWGLKKSTDTTSPPNLLDVTLHIISNEKCMNYHRALLKEETFCAGEGKEARGKDTCQGDSGGPAVYKQGGVNYVIGVVSGGPSGDSCGKGYGIYTRVTSYIGWIQENTGEKLCK